MVANVARHLQFSTAVLHETHGTAASQWICRVLSRDAGKAKSYKLLLAFARSIQTGAIVRLRKKSCDESLTARVVEHDRHSGRRVP